MAVKIKDTKDVSKDGHKILIYGKSGIGKTHLLSTLKDQIIIASEPGLMTLKNFNIPYIEVSSYDEMREAYSIVTENDNYKTICIDSITELAEIMLVDLKESNKDPRKAYGQVADDVIRMVRAFRDLKDKNVVFIAKRLRMTIENPEDNSSVDFFTPSMPGKYLLNELPYSFSGTFYMKENKNLPSGRCLMTKESPYYDAKDRSGELNECEEADLGKIFAKMDKV